MQTVEGYEPCLGPVRTVPLVTSISPRGITDGCVTVGNRVMAMWQDFGHMIGNGTVVGFERHKETGWIKVVVDYDYPDRYGEGDDGFVRWDWDRTCLCYPAHFDGETQDEAVARVRENIAKRAERVAA